jgi:hypothetical protein
LSLAPFGLLALSRARVLCSQVRVVYRGGVHYDALEL